MIAFEEAYKAFLKYHLGRRSGERLGRLERGHLPGERSFAELVWWPLMGHFSGLHPEYEVMDWRGRSYFADYAYFSGPYKFIIEFKEYAVHVRGMDRKKYCEELNRILPARSEGQAAFYICEKCRMPSICQPACKLYI